MNKEKHQDKANSSESEDKINDDKHNSDFPNLVETKKFVGTKVVSKENETFEELFYSFNKKVKRHKVRKMKKTYFLSKGQKNRQKRYKKNLFIKQERNKKRRNRTAVFA